jgi:hypothetical protein
MNKINKNDLFYTSWGYDQTNYDYIIVVSVSPTGKTCICQRANYQHLGNSGQCNIQKPIAEGYGNTFRMKIYDNYKSEPGLKGSYIFCGETSKRFDYFSKASEKQTFYETDSQFGH